MYQKILNNVYLKIVHFSKENLGNDLSKSYFIIIFLEIFYQEHAINVLRDKLLQ